MALRRTKGRQANARAYVGQPPVQVDQENGDVAPRVHKPRLWGVAAQHRSYRLAEANPIEGPEEGVGLREGRAREGELIPEEEQRRRQSTQNHPHIETQALPGMARQLQQDVESEGNGQGDGIKAAGHQSQAPEDSGGQGPTGATLLVGPHESQQEQGGEEQVGGVSHEGGAQEQEEGG